MKPLLNPRAMHSAPHDPMPMLRRLQQTIEAQQREMAALTIRVNTLQTLVDSHEHMLVKAPIAITPNPTMVAPETKRKRAVTCV
jgi:hypothetical protein